MIKNCYIHKYVSRIGMRPDIQISVIVDTVDNN